MDYFKQQSPAILRPIPEHTKCREGQRRNNHKINIQINNQKCIIQNPHLIYCILLYRFYIPRLKVKY